jgi:hypothetical protein
VVGWCVRPSLTLCSWVTVSVTARVHPGGRGHTGRRRRRSATSATSATAAAAKSATTQRCPAADAAARVTARLQDEAAVSVNVHSNPALSLPCVCVKIDLVFHECRYWDKLPARALGGTFWDTGVESRCGEWVDYSRVESLFKAPEAGRVLRVRGDGARSTSHLQILDLKRATQVRVANTTFQLNCVESGCAYP